MVAITLYDDPLNPLGWGAQPTLRRLQVECAEAEWRHVPVALVDTWDQYSGPEFPGGQRTAAATCLQIAEESGMPIDEYLWFADPPSTSIPACAGIESTTDPGTSARARLFRAAREAIYLRQTNLDNESAVADLIETVFEGNEVDTDGGDTDGVGVTERDTNVGDVPTDFTIDAEHSPPDLSAVDGVETVGDRPALPAVVVRGDGRPRGRSGRVDLDSLRTLLEEAGGSPDPERAVSVEEAVERFSPAGWLSGAELAAVTGQGYDEALDAARSGPETATEEFAAETFVRARTWTDR